MAPVPAPLPSERLVRVESQTFGGFEQFSGLLDRECSGFAARVRDALRLIALHGILDPLTDTPIPSANLDLGNGNFRETLGHEGIVSRQRAVLLTLRQLVLGGRLPPFPQLRLYLPEVVTPFAARLASLAGGFQGSEYLPDPEDPLRNKFHHEDLCALSFADASFDAVICNEILEHVYDLEAALFQMRRVLVPGGILLGTVPFAYSQNDSIVKARHRAAGESPELLMEPELHGNPVDPEHGSLVYRIPGWDLLDQLSAAGFRKAEVVALHSPSYGIVGTEIPYVLLYQAEA
jgi:SAM-dependent methyltransferase